MTDLVALAALITLESSHFPSQKMDALPQPIPPLIFASLALSTTATAFALTALSLLASPLLWTIPASFAPTLFHHTTILFQARILAHGSARVFSKFKVICAFIIALGWSLCTCVVIAATVLKSLNTFPKYDMGVGLWIMVFCATIALIESGILWGVAVLCRKERKRITYAAKWRPINTNLSWRFVTRKNFCRSINDVTLLVSLARDIQFALFIYY
ncbi:hypothetical protein D9757_000564 [Collybiopsis confluens]|uniref:Uncharacterized protein n=1 Tax=Collybiopsis confluens TaxID=2823264 RepID=A0A8H5I1I8_9AGAR|nr:hypothetical protein D9757_000564 [Collybiopsis confluens]